MSPQKIVDLINDYFGTDIKQKMRNTNIESRCLKQVAMKIFIENYRLEHGEVASLLNCGRSNVTQLYKKINSIIDIDKTTQNFYRLTLNLIINNLPKNGN